VPAVEVHTIETPQLMAKSDLESRLTAVVSIVALAITGVLAVLFGSVPAQVPGYAAGAAPRQQRRQKWRIGC
jgi:hypothetical protein